MSEHLKRDLLTVVKLGGSLVTNKDRPLSINRTALRAVARQLEKWKRSNAGTKIILVHGGGSFGHYYAKRFGLTPAPNKTSAEAVSMTTQAMVDLHREIRAILSDRRVYTETILPREILSQHKARLSINGIRRLSDCFQNDLIPLTFGYVDIGSNGAAILSGDLICEALARSLKVSRQIFAMDVDGIYPSQKLEGKIFRRLRKEDGYSGGNRKYDVTGGVGAKVRLGFKLAERGTEVYFVNGMTDERLLKLILGRKDILSTAIEPKI